MSEQKDMLRETVTRLFGDLVTRDCLIAAEDGGFPDALWNALEENGLTLALTPEDKGGVGASWDDVFVIMHAAGEFAAPAPLVETLLARWLLAQAGLDTPEGPLTVAHHLQTENLIAKRGSDGWRASGTLRAVPWGRHAGHVVALVEVDEKPHLALLPVAESVLEPDANIAREPRDTLTFDGAPVAVADPLAIAGDSIFIYGAMARSAQIAGACQKALDEAVQYALDRTQFGRPIAKFQAIQQQLATLAAKTAQANIAAAAAFRAADRHTPTFEAACAKVVAGEAAGLATTVAHQVHGAIGFTYEHALHFTTRRLWSWRPEFGSETQWAEELGRTTAERGAAALWPDLTARQSGQGA
jgi:acyl-CoA dehydrogenase